MSAKRSGFKQNLQFFDKLRMKTRPLESLRLMEGIADIYMPDFKFWDPTMARRYSCAPDYPEVARQAIKKMHRQVGPLVVDDGGVATRRLLLHHLVMPNDICGTCEIIHWVARELGTDTYVNIIPQYHPAGKISDAQYSEINRCLTHREFRQAIQAGREVGLFRLDLRSAWQANICWRLMVCTR
jgi:putative pyruvate formate lyase activating enzyme